MLVAAVSGMLIVTLITVTVSALALLIWRPPAVVIRYLQRRWPDVVWQGPNIDEKVVALTIDDAPSEHTQELLEILQANAAAATFFVIGSYMPGREDILQQLVVSGNELGNHALYDEPSWKLSDDELQSQILTLDKKIGAVYKAARLPCPPKYYRPGSGFFTSAMRQIVKNLGYRLVLGSIYPHDPQIHSATLNAWHVMSLLRPGAIIICHDGRSWTAPMLRMILPRIKNRGYRVVRLTELLQKG